MTANVPIGAARHLFNQQQAATTSTLRRPRPVQQDINSGKSRFTALAFRFYRFLSSKRQRLLPLTARAAGIVDRRLISAATSAAFLRFANRQLATHPRFGVIIMQMILITLAAATQIHLAASRKPSALRA